MDEPDLRAAVGARLKWLPADRHALRLGVYNGWNSVVDNNAEKSLGVDYLYTVGRSLKVGAVYFTGVERDEEATEGRGWRQLLDIYFVAMPQKRLTLLREVNGGFEPTDVGLSAWIASNLSSRLTSKSVRREHRVIGKSR
ncbi:MAG: outer membrane beta-barrel protein [Myxococcales bacterium]|nr:outer membrane beta-barrel protein [Myxococcales bacterium]